MVDASANIRYCSQLFFDADQADDALQAAIKENPENATYYSDAPIASTTAPVDSAVVDDPAALGLYLRKVWRPGRTLRCRFLGGTTTVQNKVKQYAVLWSQHANINFQFVDAGDAEIRISFTPRIGSSSRIGTDCLLIPADQPTMNFGWFADNTADEEFARTTLHEFGHALGCVHEHQQPNANIPWNRPVVYQSYAIWPGWPRWKVDQDVFAQYPANQVTSTAFDRLSIMEYPIPAEFTTDGSSYPNNSRLSDNDVAFIRRMYPFPPANAGLYQTGNVNTVSVRSAAKSALETFVPASFAITFAAPPRVLMGLNWLDFGTGKNIRMDLVAQNVRTDGMTVKFRSWVDSLTYAAGCAWLAPPATDVDFQHGHFATWDDHSWDKPQMQTSRRVTFPQPYASPPTVIVWLDQLDIGYAAPCRVKAYCDNVQADGFTMHIDTWLDSKIYLGGACWAAYSANRRDICSGSFSTNDVRSYSTPRAQNSNLTMFSRPFARPPRLFMALNILDISNKYPARIYLSASDVSATDFTWHLDSWKDTVLYSAGASYIAFL